MTTITPSTAKWTIDPNTETWKNEEGRKKLAFYARPVEYAPGAEPTGLHGWAMPVSKDAKKETYQLIENAKKPEERNQGFKTLATVNHRSNQALSNLRAKIAKTGPFLSWVNSKGSAEYLLGSGAKGNIDSKYVDIQIHGKSKQLPQQGHFAPHLQALYDAASQNNTRKQNRFFTQAQKFEQRFLDIATPFKRLKKKLQEPKVKAFIMAAGASTRMHPAVADLTTGKAGTVFATVDIAETFPSTRISPSYTTNSTTSKPSAVFTPLENEQQINFIDLHMMNAKRAGIDNVIISLLKKDEASKKHAVQMARNLGMKVQFVIDEEPTGTAGPIQKASQHKGYKLDGKDLVVLSGDGFHAYDLKQAMKDHKKHGQAISLIGDAKTSEEDLKSFGYAVANKNGKIERFDEKPGKEKSQAQIMQDYGVTKPEDIAKVALANTGVYIFGKDTLPMIRTANKETDQNHTDGRDKLDIAGLFGKLFKGKLGLIQGRNNILRQWRDIGNPEALSDIIQESNTNHFVMPGTHMVALHPNLHEEAKKDGVKTEGLSFILKPQVKSA